MPTDNVFSILDRVWAKGAPVDIQAVIRDAGIIYKEEDRPSTVSGLIEVDDGVYRIVVNSTHSNVRRRFTAAHELGHFVYHRDLIGDGIWDDAAYRSVETKGHYFNTKILKEHESQANRFAAVALMPSLLIDQIKQEKSLDFGIPGDVVKLANILQVSEQAMRIRLALD